MSRRDEEGAYLVIYALLAVVFFTMAAVVLDIAALRNGRRADRTAVDLAATAGVVELAVSDPTSYAGACEAAWGYLLANRTEAGGTTTAPDCVGGFPATPCDGTTPRTVSGTIGPLTVEITHPVLDGSPLMLAEAQGGDVAQAIEPATDGTACERLGIRVLRSRTLLFGGLTGFESASTDVHAVARPLTATSSTEVPAVVALEPTGCDALVTDAAGGTLSLGSAASAGIAIVDSSASGCAAGAFAIDGGPGGISAVGAGVTSPQIRSFALSQSSFAGAYDPADVAGGRLSPTPSPALTRTGRSIVDNRYHCPSCGPGGDPIGQLEAERNVAGAPATATTTTTTCAVPAGPPVVVTDVHVYVDCDNLVVDGSVTFFGQSVTVKGNVVIGPGACVAVNDAICGAAGVPPGDADLFIRGSFSKDVKGQLALRNTFVYTGGSLDIGVDPDTNVGNSYLSWTAPTAGGFEDLLLWTESPGPVVLGEQKTVALVGTLAAPNAAVVLNARNNAGGVTSQLQIVARTVRSTGDGTFRLQPTPARATGALTRQVRLIR